MAFSRTAPLRREIEATLLERPAALEFWDGTRVEATVPTHLTLSIRSPRALARLLPRPTQLRAGRAYVAGEIEANDLDAVVDLVDWRPAEPPDARRLGRLVLAIAQAAGLQRPPQPPSIEYVPARARRFGRGEEVRHHYDVSNDFYRLFLDRTLTYSCGLFRDGASFLEEAQEAKLDLVCRKLDLQAGQRVLDVGCGWGSFAIHAAARYGVRVLGVTLSEPQAALARARVAEAGLADRVEVRVADYAELTEEGFDAIASIGMVEHVGLARIEDFTTHLVRLLRPGGLLLLHGISRLPPGRTLGSTFSERYVFPGGDVLHLSTYLDYLERAGFETLHVDGLRDDYIETLRQWTERLDERREDAERLAGPERVRVWRLYLRAARHGFEVGYSSIYQIRATAPRGATVRAWPPRLAVDAHEHERPEHAPLEHLVEGIA